MKSKTTFSILWISYVSLVVSVIVMLMTHTLSLMGVLSPTTSKMVEDILVSVWVPIGLVLITLIFCTEPDQRNTSNDQTLAQEGHIQKQWNVTGMAQQTGSSFTMDLRLWEIQNTTKPLQDTQTVTQRQ
jgi:hypothetical protein